MQFMGERSTMWASTRGLKNREGAMAEPAFRAGVRVQLTRAAVLLTTARPARSAEVSRRTYACASALVEDECDVSNSAT